MHMRGKWKRREETVYIVPVHKHEILSWSHWTGSFLWFCVVMVTVCLNSAHYSVKSLTAWLFLECAVRVKQALWFKMDTKPQTSGSVSSELSHLPDRPECGVSYLRIVQLNQTCVCCLKPGKADCLDWENTGRLGARPQESRDPASANNYKKTVGCWTAWTLLRG